MKHLALICLALTACIDSQPETSTRTSDLASSVYPHQWNTRMVGQNYFWPPDATSVQVLITDGDRQNGQDTFYAWLIRDGRTVFTVYRVDKSNTIPFQGAMRSAFGRGGVGTWPSVSGAFGGIRPAAGGGGCGNDGPAAGSRWRELPTIV